MTSQPGLYDTLDVHLDRKPVAEYRLIPLTRGYWALVDADDYERLAKHKWRAWVSQAGKAYAVRWAKTAEPRQLIWMHREIMHAKNGEEVDHIDGDSLKNPKYNLRRCTRQQNCLNRGLNSNNTSGAKGVCRYHRKVARANTTQWQKDLHRHLRRYR